MNDNLDFYKWFDGIAPKLDNREISFRKIFKYLDSQPNPIIIVDMEKPHYYSTNILYQEEKNQKYILLIKIQILLKSANKR